MCMSGVHSGIHIWHISTQLAIYVYFVLDWITQTEKAKKLTEGVSTFSSRKKKKKMEREREKMEYKWGTTFPATVNQRQRKEWKENTAINWTTTLEGRSKNGFPWFNMKIPGCDIQWPSGGGEGGGARDNRERVRGEGRRERKRNTWREKRIK